MNKSWSLILLFWGLATSLLFAPTLEAQKLTATELITKHLNAVGAAAVTRKTTNVQGRGRLQILVGGRANLQGPFYLQSQGDQISYYLHFDIATYEHERLIADPAGAEIGYMTPGTRSPLADFLYTQKLILREGLWGGVLSTAYPLFDIASRQADLKYAGLKKEDGRKLHRLDYGFKRPQGNLKVRLFFDPDTFQHVRTTYELTLPAPLGRDTIESARQKLTRHELTEDFSDFREESGMMMPHKWVVRYSYNSTDQTLSWEWSHEIIAFHFNEKLNPSVFQSVAPGPK